MFEYYGHTHVYSPGAGTDNPLGPKYFHKHKSYVHLLILSKFFALRMFAANIRHFGTSGFSFLEYLANGCRYFPNILYLDTY